METRGRKKLTQEQIDAKNAAKEELKRLKKLKKGSIIDIEYNPWYIVSYSPGYVIDENGKEIKLICF